MAKTRKFYNWSDESFSYPWASEPYTFEPGEERIMEAGVAEHFAKHLADRELRRQGYNPGEIHIRKRFVKKGLTGKEAQMSEEKMKQKVAETTYKHEKDMSEIEKLAEEYMKLTEGEKPDGRWSKSTLKEKIDDMKADVKKDEEQAFEPVQ